MPDKEQSDYITHGHSFSGSTPYDEHAKLKSEIDKLKADFAAANELLKHKDSCINAMAWRCAKYHEVVAMLRRWSNDEDFSQTDTDDLLAAIDAYEENLKKQT